MTQQQRRDALARSKGYRNYTEYRNALARAMGYRNYSEQRKARRTGIGIQPRDPKYVPRVTPPPTFVSDGDLLKRFVPIHPSAINRSILEQYDLAEKEIVQTQDRMKLRSFVTEDAHRHLLGGIDNLDERAKEFYEQDLQRIYLEGARAGSGDPLYRLGSHERDEIARLQRKGMKEIEAAHKATRRSIRREVGAGNDRIRRNMVRGIVYGDGSRRTLSDYSKMSIRTNSQMAYNLAGLSAAEATGHKWVEVVDGGDCGWNSHRDAEKANGKVVSIKEARDHPLAHPNCQRRFVPRRDLDGKPTSAKAKAIKALDFFVPTSASEIGQDIRSAIISGVASKALNPEFLRRVAEIGFRASPRFVEYGTRVSAFKRLLEFGIKNRQTENIFDIATGELRSVGTLDILRDAVSYADDFVEGRALPAHVRYLLGVKQEAPRKVVGDAFDHFSRYVTEAHRAQLSMGDVIDVFNLENTAFNTFYDWATANTQGRFVRVTFPRLGRPGDGETVFDPFKVIQELLGAVRDRRLPDIEAAQRFTGAIEGRQRALRFTLDPAKMIRATATRTSRGVINHLSINRHGLLRMGFSWDPETLRVFPTFRLVPNGPIRIATKINRGISGNITSITGELRVITRSPVNLKAGFNLNLRNLGLNTMRDIKKLRPADLLKFTAEDIRMVSLAADLRRSGLTVFDFARVFRIDWETAVKMWHMTDSQLRDALADLRALKARNKFTLVEGLGEGPKRPPGTRRPILRLVDPEEGDPFAGLDSPLPTVADSSKPGIFEKIISDLSQKIPQTGRVIERYPKVPNHYHIVDLPGANPILLDDINQTLNMLADKFPNLPKITVTSGTTQRKSVMAEFNPRTLELRISDTWAKDWGSKKTNAKIADMVYTDWFSGNNTSPVRVLVHETGHHLHFQAMDLLPEEFNAGLIDLLEEKFEWDTVPGNYRFYTDDWVTQNADAIRQRLGAYGTTNWMEFIAECYAEFITSATPSKLARVVGEYLEAALK